MSNMSKEKRNNMLVFLQNLKQYHKDDEKLIAINEIENALSEKKYGLVWEEHLERVDQELEMKIPVFKEISDKEILTDKNLDYNFLIEGDNLHSLYLLEKTHKGKVDVIYIDPPYNTGNQDFVYDDKYINKDDGYKHSKWISFMDRRLRIAKNILSEDGILFINIDDNEVSQLKLLTDEIMGEDNFIISIPRQTKKSGKTTGSFSKNHDYVLVYTNKNKDVFIMEEFISDTYDQEDEFVEERGKYRLNQTLDYNSLVYGKTLDYPLDFKGKTYYPGGNYEAYLNRQEGNYKRADWAWRWSKRLFEFGEKNGFVVLNENTGRIYTKTYSNAIIEERLSKDGNGKEYYIKYKKQTKPHSSLEFTNNIYSNDRAKKDLAKYGLGSNFDYSKPVQLIKTLIKSHYNKDAIVLDFFAGSGTTGQAVLELNNEDEGKRKFIICTNNENSICDDVTYPRMERVIKGYPFKGKEETILYEEKFNQSHLKNMDKIWKDIETIKEVNKTKFDKISTSFNSGVYSIFGIKEFDTKTDKHITNLKYYQTGYIDRYNDEDIYISDELMNHIKEMIQLENHISIDNEKYNVFFNDEDVSNLFANIARINTCRIIFKPIHVFLNTEELKIVSDNNIEVINIPEYYFASELKEVGEI